MRENMWFSLTSFFHFQHTIYGSFMFQYESGLHSFLLATVPPYGYTTLCYTTHQLTSELFPCLGYCVDSCFHYSQEQTSGSCGNHIFKLVRTVNLLSKVAAPFYISTGAVEGFNFTISSQCLLLCFLNDHPSEYEVISHII